ncbi:hypothetical protein [Sphingomicrobium sediminis]|uniref:Haem-binding uptake Tiki superfamily ChaN domain-containing protein n=1 Tax=Sphingomicrobium sediminis TaxID=2950949 RepID=A0A9X2EEI4_9SPHN|nr:hypothetical protein [Sphingomicrobium sediminis]MCM8556543.1 hypothetical protein [Sphingomicrobium sediminis]
MALGAASPASDCNPLPGWETVAQAADGKFLIFGESHGTAESPAAVAEYICAISETRSVLLAIEFNATSDDAFREVWNGPHEGFRERMIKTVGEWTGREDGVASVAMLDMLERLHALKSAGRDIDITSFNGSKNETQRRALASLPAQEPHEASQALNIRAAADRGKYDQVVVLVGELHSRQSAVSMGGEPFRPMAAILDAETNVVSLYMIHGPGETWSCQLAIDPEDMPPPGTPITDDMIACAAHPTPANHAGDRAPGFHLIDGENALPDFDGVFHVGPVTASPPASSADPV